MKTETKNYIDIILGIFLLSAGINIFYIPNDLVSGGVSGLGIIVRAISERMTGFPIPVSLTNIVFNIPLFFAAYIRFGSRYLKRSIFASLIFSVTLQITELLPEFRGEIMLASVFGGILSGTGVGLIFNGSATTGGTETAAHILHDIYDRFSVSDYVLMVDSLIIAVGFAVFGAEKTLYSIISVFAASRCIAAITSGTSVDKAAIVISDKFSEVSDRISGLDLPVLKSFSPNESVKSFERPIICVFSQNEVNLFKETVRSADTNAFIILFDIKEAYGKGFKKL